MTRCTLLVPVITLTVLLPWDASAQVNDYPLKSLDHLRLHTVAARPVVLQGKKGLRVTFSEDTLRRFKDMTPEQQHEPQARVGQYAIIEGLEFANGVIEAEVAGGVAPEATALARRFVGIAFRLQNGTCDGSTCVPPTAAPTIRSDGIMPSSTSHTRTGRGSGFARRHRPSTKRTQTSCRACGEDPDRSWWRTGTSLRPRPGAADADRH
jgi:hypothetical protein